MEHSYKNPKEQKRVRGERGREARGWVVVGAVVEGWQWHRWVAEGKEEDEVGAHLATFTNAFSRIGRMWLKVYNTQT